MTQDSLNSLLVANSRILADSFNILGFVNLGFQFGLGLSEFYFFFSFFIILLVEQMNLNLRAPISALYPQSSNLSKTFNQSLTKNSFPLSKNPRKENLSPLQKSNKPDNTQIKAQCTISRDRNFLHKWRRISHSVDCNHDYSYVAWHGMAWHRKRLWRRFILAPSSSFNHL